MTQVGKGVFEELSINEFHHRAATIFAERSLPLCDWLAALGGVLATNLYMPQTVAAALALHDG